MLKGLKLCINQLISQHPKESIRKQSEQINLATEYTNLQIGSSNQQIELTHQQIDPSKISSRKLKLKTFKKVL